MQTQELDLMTLVGPFQIRILCDSVILRFYDLSISGTDTSFRLPQDLIKLKSRLNLKKNKQKKNSPTMQHSWKTLNFGTILWTYCFLKVYYVQWKITNIYKTLVKPHVSSDMENLLSDKPWKFDFIFSCIFLCKCLIDYIPETCFQITAAKCICYGRALKLLNKGVV